MKHSDGHTAIGTITCHYLQTLLARKHLCTVSCWNSAISHFLWCQLCASKSLLQHFKKVASC